VALGGCAIQPKEISLERRAALAQADLAALFTDQEPVTGPIDLYEAMARAVKYNLDERLKLMEEALARGQLKALRYELLPRLTTDAGYHWRNNENGASSVSLLTGTQSLEPSTSQERNRSSADGIIAWNVLDFGVSYASAQQQADQVLIAEQRRRKVVQNILQDVRVAYWRAVSADQLLPQMDRILDQANAALNRVESLQKLHLTPTAQALNYRKGLLEIIRQMWALRQELASARTDLGTLMNLRPGTPYELAVTDQGAALAQGDLRASIERLEQLALLNRPELVEEHYQARVSATEVHKALLRMLPGLELNIGQQYDSNKYLFNHGWVEASAAVSWNLVNAFAGPRRLAAARAKLKVDEARRLALSMAVLTQVRLAYQRLGLAQHDYRVANELLDVETQLSSYSAAAQAAQTGNELERVRALSQALVARMRRDNAFAELQNAFGRLQSSVGYDGLPTQVASGDVAGLARAIRETPEDWLANLPSPPETPAPAAPSVKPAPALPPTPVPGAPTQSSPGSGAVSPPAPSADRGTPFPASLPGA
jgi:outer membrane protein TolC